MRAWLILAPILICWVAGEAVAFTLGPTGPYNVVDANDDPIGGLVSIEPGESSIVTMTTTAGVALLEFSNSSTNSPELDAFSRVVDETPIEDLTGDEKARLRAMGYLQDD